MRKSSVISTICSIILTFLTIALPSGCVRNEVSELQQSLTSVNVVFDWKDNFNTPLPDVMTVYFFPSDGRSLSWRFNINVADGGEISIPCGKYNAIAVNPDAEGLMYKDSGFTSFEIQLSRFASLPSGISSSSPTMLPPSQSYCAIATDITITPCGISYRPDGGNMEGCMKECPYSLLRLYPYSPLANYTIIVKGIENIGSVENLSCSLSSMASGYFPAHAAATDSGVNLPVQLKREIGEANFSNSFKTFGTVNGSRSILNLYVTLKGGKKKLLQYDVTSQIVNSPDKYNVLICIENPDFSGDPDDTDPDSPEGGFDVDVSGWIVIKIDYTYP